ncbi:MAG: N-acetyltransferase [Lysobacteraceae bacterium]|nr:MAG: N-acetyltransferase [Xanthomonadaceae bacterium]
MSLFLHLPHKRERIRLRKLRPSDFRAFHAYRGDPDVARYQGWEPMSQDEAMQFLREYGRNAGLEPGEWAQLGIALSEDDHLIGDAGLWLGPDGRRAEFGISLHRDFQGRGYAREAGAALLDLLFAHTAVGQVRAATDVRNAACARMLQALGMRLVDSAQTEYKGEMCTEQVFVIEREERTR